MAIAKALGVGLAIVAALGGFYATIFVISGGQPCKVMDKFFGRRTPVKASNIHPNSPLSVLFNAAKCNANDQKIWQTEQATLPQDLLMCMSKCMGLDGKCIGDCFHEMQNYSAECSECFGELPTCVVAKCQSKCSDPTHAIDCVTCMKDALPQCAEGFEQCTGFTAVQTEVLQQAELHVALQTWSSIEMVEFSQEMGKTKCSAKDKKSIETNGENGSLMKDFTACLMNECPHDNKLGKCVGKCMSKKEELSKNCGICFGHLAMCPFEDCEQECKTGDARKCNACYGGKCMSPFRDCVGLTFEANFAMQGEVMMATNTIVMSQEVTPVSEEVKAADRTVVNLLSRLGKVFKKQCSDKDREIIQKKLQDQSLARDFQTCISSCNGKESCVTNCMRKKDRFSQGCAGCFGAAAACPAKRCASACKSDAKKCENCVKKRCMPRFQKCLGVGEEDEDENEKEMSLFERAIMDQQEQELVVYY